MAGFPVVIVPNGGLPVTEVAAGFGTPVEIAANGFGFAVTIVASGGLPVNGSGIGSFSPSLDFSDDRNSQYVMIVGG